jgi:hypothetical protein
VDSPAFRSTTLLPGSSEPASVDCTKSSVIAEDIWAKLLWAGINLTQEDLTTSFFSSRHFYPLAMVKALTIVWLFFAACEWTRFAGSVSGACAPMRARPTALGPCVTLLSR